MNEKQVWIIKDMGILMVVLTLVAGAIYTILDLHIIVLGDGNLLRLRIMGLLLVSIIAYVPYYLVQKIMKLVEHKNFLLGVSSVMAIIDVFWKIDLIFAISKVPGFMGIVFWPIIFSCVVILVYGVELFIRYCKNHKLNYCYRFGDIMRKKYMAILLKMKNI
jgi:hypothetical protein